MLNLNNDYPILVCSCEKTKSIAMHMLMSLDKYANKKIHIYIGVDLKLKFDNLDIEYIETKKSNWKNETLYQINYIRKKTNSNNFMIILDDFIFNKNIDFDLIQKLFLRMNELKLKHLLLKPIDDSLLLNFIGNFTKKSILSYLYYKKVRVDHPYFSSLQIAIWDFDHFINTLSTSDDIWNFENQKNYELEHNCLTIPILHYRHIVEKGEWDFFSKSYCLKYISFFEQSNIKFKKLDFKILCVNLFKKNIIFPFFGYFFTKEIFNKKE